MKTLLTSLLMVVVAVGRAAEPATAEPPAAALTRLGAVWLARDALATQARYVKAARTSEGDASPEIWGDALKELKPRRVYFHQVNVVVVLQAEGQTEAGLYITAPFSSYIPMDGTDGFKYARLAGGVLAYSRRLPASSPSPVRPSRPPEAPQGSPPPHAGTAAQEQASNVR